MSLSGERFFVTGATGFVGACLARKLADLGCEVHLLERENAKRWRLRGVENAFTFHRGDLTDLECLRKIVSKVQPTVIYHLGVHGAYPFQTDADETIRTNVFGSWNLLKACSDIDYKVFVNTGSSSEYGNKPHAMRESDVLEPNSYYAVAKSAQTLVCRHTARIDKRPINTFRLFSVYGPYEEPSRLVPTVIRNCLEGRELKMVSPETARDFIYVEDVVDAYLRIDELSRHCGEVFNIGTGVQSTVRDVVEASVQATGASPKVSWDAMPHRPWDTETWVADCTKVRRMLKWTAGTGLRRGIAKTVEWARSEQPSGDASTAPAAV
jgi:nucleoside-diphosphate-sugar epimerase